MSVLGKKYEYDSLNGKQKEIFNFQKVSAVFADYGFTTIKLADDWMGADFLAFSFDGETTLKVQLKGRLSFWKKYQKKNLYVCFFDRKGSQWYLYPHDELLSEFVDQFKETESWSKEDGGYDFPSLSAKAISALEKYKI